jgi:hypothetical protein
MRSWEGITQTIAPSWTANDPNSDLRNSPQGMAVALAGERISQERHPT